MRLTDEQLLLVNGGATLKAVLGGIAVAISFIVGVVDGYLRPMACRK